MNDSSDRPNSRHDEISALAQRYYDEEGQPEGKDLEHWLRAERELGASGTSSDPNTPPPASTPETSASSGEELS
jgi:hypothetical protein